MLFKSTAAFAVMSVFAVQSAEAWSIQFQDTSASTPEYSEKLTSLSDNTCYNMNDLPTANPWNDRVDNAWIIGAICVFWADYGCSGHHTKTETGAAGTHLVDFDGGGFDGLGNLYFDQGKLKEAEEMYEEAEEMYERVLAGRENALGLNHTSILDIVNNLGILYKDQWNLEEVKEMYERALVVYGEALGLDHRRMQQVTET